MKPKWKVTPPPISVQILCKCKYDDTIYYVVLFYTGTEFINPETHKPEKHVVGWDYIGE